MDCVICGPGFIGKCPHGGATASQINLEAHQLHHLSISRSQELLRRFGSNVTFDDLLAMIYKQGFEDAKSK